MLKLGIKTAIFGGSVYYTVEKGVWKDCATTNALYKELEEGVSPYVGELKKHVPYELPTFPTNDVTYLFKYYWNQGVKSTFRFLVELPNYASVASENVISYINTTLEATSDEQSKPENVEKSN